MESFQQLPDDAVIIRRYGDDSLPAMTWVEESIFYEGDDQRRKTNHEAARMIAESGIAVCVIKLQSVDKPKH